MIKAMHIVVYLGMDYLSVKEIPSREHHSFDDQSHNELNLYTPMTLSFVPVGLLRGVVHREDFAFDKHFEHDLHKKNDCFMDMSNVNEPTYIPGRTILMRRNYPKHVD